MVNNLKHITRPEIALKIADTGTFVSHGSNGHYDGGMNFIGVLGQNQNTQPRGTGATIICEWPGKVSTPLPYDYPGPKNPNELMDFNGSSQKYSNNDPRYLLPNGSCGLLVKDILFDNEEKLLEGWCYFKGGIRKRLYKCKVGRGALLFEARRYLARVQKRCQAGEIKVNVVYVP